MEYFLRIYIECDKEDIAREQARAIIDRLSHLGKVSLFKIKEYWKIENYFEVSFEIESTLSLGELSRSITGDWQYFADDCIWHLKADYFLNFKDIRWASLERI